jgi:hypothetical protein
MAIHQIQPGYNKWAHLGEILGNAIGSGTANYLSGKKKERELAQREKALEGLVGPEKAKMFAGLDDKLIGLFLKQEQVNQEREALSNLSSQLDSRGPVQSPQDMLHRAPEGNVVGGISDTLNRPSAQLEQPMSMTEKLLGLQRGNVNPLHFNQLLKEAEAVDRLRQGEQKNRTMQEAPRRKQVEARVATLEQKVEKAPRRIADYEMLDQLARSGQLHAGIPKRITDALGINPQGSPSDVAQKIMENLNLERMLASVPGGRATARLMEQIGKTNPSLINNPKSISVLSQLMINQEKEDVLLNEEVQKLVDKNGGLAPIGVFKQAEKNIGNDLKKLHEQSKELLEITYDLKPENKSSGSLKDFQAGEIVQDEDTGEYLVIEANGKTRKATAAELKSVGV